MICPGGMAPEKALLRKQLKVLRNSIPDEKRQEWSLKICKHIEKLCESRRIIRVGAFWPFGSEVDLRPLVKSRPDWVFVFPRVSSTHPPRLAWGPEPLEPGLFGLMEPVLAQHFMPPVQILLVPGLGFDMGGYRIGYGGGFYDALLDRLDGGIITLGAAFSAQRVHELPIGPYDQPVQGIVTEAGVEWANQTRDNELIDN
jgi:5-formyltetrahydrofolate cyclo-ligase